ncbi:MAG: hypothetical protein OXK17_01900 [Thaumarchaeota archaeon]|nr:hypothetical protein [Nitrososphaerota archaeon]
MRYVKESPDCMPSPRRQDVGAVMSSWAEDAADCMRFKKSSMDEADACVMGRAADASITASARASGGNPANASCTEMATAAQAITTDAHKKNCRAPRPVWCSGESRSSDTYWMARVC